MPSMLLFFNSFCPKGTCVDLEGEGGAEGESIHEREKHQSVASRTCPDRDSNP